MPEAGEAFTFPPVLETLQRYSLAFPSEDPAWFVAEGRLPLDDSIGYGTGSPFFEAPCEACDEPGVGNYTGILGVTFDADVHPYDLVGDGPDGLLTEEQFEEYLSVPVKSITFGLRDDKFVGLSYFGEWAPAEEWRTVNLDVHVQWIEILFAALGLDPSIFDARAQVEEHYGEWSGPDGFTCSLPGDMEIGLLSPFIETGEEFNPWGASIYSSLSFFDEAAPEC